ncbi:MAG TPA: tetratricopeptide repeat protein [Allosphingosinicella sp.]|jgi:cytochrome c-type biogenesis protein CcmH|nr:tetratricopeptide repeat protein [Allosphingosinicella sp.]
MGGWLILILLLLALAAGLYPFVRKDKGALQFLAAALLLALAGYARQGSPGSPGHPKQAATASETGDDDFAILRPHLLGRYDRAAYWMTLADADRRRGDPHAAAARLGEAVRSNPRDAGLWIAYGYALIAAGGGQPGPAAQLAFERAARLAPDDPGPMFFHALALTRMPRLEAYQQAFGEWRELLPNVPEASPYRAAIAERLAALEEALSTGTRLRPASPPQAPAPPALPTAAP